MSATQYDDKIETQGDDPISSSVSEDSGVNVKNAKEAHRAEVRRVA